MEHSARVKQSIVTLDLEGVLVPEIWIAVAEKTGIKELRRTTREEPDYDKLMQGRLKILDAHGLKLSDIQQVIGTLAPLAGAREFLDELRATTQVLILSDTFEQFATCLNDADVAVIAPVYAAGEQPIDRITRDTYAEALRAHGHRNVLTIEGEADLAATVKPYLKPGAVIVGTGAGSITVWMHNLQKKLEGR